jgi:hypothetical protein
MTKRVQIGERRKGSLAQNEDWWHLVVEDDGSHHVEHEWSYVDPYGKGPGSEGTKSIPTNEFLASDAGPGLKGELRAAMKTFGVS